MAEPSIQEIPIASIIVGERHRRDLGDIGKLAKNIEKLGLLHPIGITADKRLIFGERRLEAYRDHLKKSRPNRKKHYCNKSHHSP